MIDDYYRNVASNHAESVRKKGKKIIIHSEWKGDEDASLCREFVDDKKSKQVKRCGKPVTHQVIWTTPRFYGFKVCTETFCLEHAKAWLKYVSRDKSRPASEMRKI